MSLVEQNVGRIKNAVEKRINVTSHGDHKSSCRVGEASVQMGGERALSDSAVVDKKKIKIWLPVRFRSLRVWLVLSPDDEKEKKNYFMARFSSTNSNALFSIASTLSASDKTKFSLCVTQPSCRKNFYISALRKKKRLHPDVTSTPAFIMRNRTYKAPHEIPMQSNVRALP